MAICVHAADVTCVYCDLGARTGFVRVSPGPVFPQVLATTNVDPDAIKKTYDEMNAAVERKQRRERRERIATAVFAAHTHDLPSSAPNYLLPDLAKFAVKAADALIAELDKESE